MTADEQVALHMLQKQSNPDIAPFPGVEDAQAGLGQGAVQGNTGTRTTQPAPWTIPGQPVPPRPQ
jgi:hypothetical protein